jgi:hypothetical protein
MMDPVETVKAYLEKQRHSSHGNWATWLEEERQATDAYRALSEAQTRHLADYGLTLFDESRGSDQDRGYIRAMLGDLAIFVPGALHSISPKLMERELFWPGQMYLHADTQTRDQLLTLVEQARDHQMLANVLTCLAWIGDETVQAKLSGWRGKLALPFDGAIEWYTREAGWELSSTGQRRNLYHQQWRQLLPIKPSDQPATHSPASAGALHDEPCQWCGLPMAYIIDLNLRDPYLAFLGLPGERLRIPFCEWCTLATIMYSDIDFSGSARWSAANKSSNDIGEPGNQYNPFWQEVHYTPSSLSANPYEPLTTCVLATTYLGGLPQWIQTPEYPLCPGCQQSMRCLGQFNPGDIMLGGDEGFNYAFLCVNCRKAAVCHQQT